MEATYCITPPTDDADFLQVLDLCDPVSADPEGWEALMSWSPGEAVTAWLGGFRAAMMRSAIG